MGKSAADRLVRKIGLGSTPADDLPASQAVLRQMVERGLIKRRLRDGIEHFELTERAIEVLRRAHVRAPKMACGDRIDVYRAQHMDIRVRKARIDGKRHEVAVNLAESPIWHLRQLKTRDGRRYFSDRDFLAAQCLRDDFERAALVQRVSARYDPVYVDCSRKEGTITDAQIHARRRLMDALDAAPEETRDILWRVCCMGDRVRAAEMTLGVPRHSGRLLLKIGLGAVAGFYCL